MSVATMEHSGEYKKSMGAVALPALAFISIWLTCPPLMWHIKNQNLAACSLIFWVMLANIFVFINALIWPTDDIQNWWNGVGLCDIEVKLTWAFSVGASGSLACIMRNLANVMAVERATLVPTKAQRRRRTIEDLIWCYGFSIWVMAVDYVVQSNRYYIFTIAGCTPAVDNSWLSIVLIFVWPPLLIVIESYYSVLVIIRLYKYRQQFALILSSANSNLNQARFMRLFLLALTLLIVFLPLQFYILYRNVALPQHPYDWNVVHGPTWSTIIMVPTGGQVTFDRWIRVGCGYLLFLFFGVGKDAMDMYQNWMVKCGAGKLFPSLIKPTPGAPTASTTTYSRPGYFSSKARLIFRKGSSATSTSGSGSNTSHTSLSTVGINRTQSHPSQVLRNLRMPSVEEMSEKPLPMLPASARKPWHINNFTARTRSPQPATTTRSNTATLAAGDEEMQLSSSVFTEVRGRSATYCSSDDPVPQGRMKVVHQVEQHVDHLDSDEKHYRG